MLKTPKDTHRKGNVQIDTSVKDALAYHLKFIDTP